MKFIFKNILNYICFISLFFPALANADKLYVTFMNAKSVYQIDLNNKKVSDEFPVTSQSLNVSVEITLDGKTLYIIDKDPSSQKFDDARLRKIDVASKKVIQEIKFPNRLANSTFDLSHLTKDEKYLFILTQELVSASMGVRNFLVKENKFSATGMTAKMCPMPRYESGPNGRIVALCFDFFHNVFYQDSVKNLMTGQQRYQLPMQMPADFTMSSDENRLYFLGSYDPFKKWVLSYWDKSSQSKAEIDLHKKLSYEEKQRGLPYHTFLALSADDTNLAILHKTTLWILDAKDFSLKKTIKLPLEFKKIIFSLDGKKIYSLGSESLQKKSQLVEVDVETGKFETYSMSFSVNNLMGISTLKIRP